MLTVTLSGCAKTICEPRKLTLNLPEMPLASSKVADELQTLCVKDSCKNINDWLNRLYNFRVQYLIYKEELAK
jgi:hypothetical protein